MNNRHVISEWPRTLVTVALAAFIIVLAPGPGRAGDSHDVRFAKTLLSLRDAIDGAVIAEVMPGTALRVLATKGAWLEVAVSGWSPAGGENYLFKEMGQRIRLAKLTEKGRSLRTVIAEKEDYYENTWQNARLAGWVKAADTAADIDAVWAEASDLFHKRCTRCHALHRPTEFTANQWPSILKIMTVRAGLSADRKALVTQFLQTHAKGQKGAAAATTAGSKRGASKTQTATAEEAPASDQPPHITGDAKLAATGAALFQSRNCVACHGDDARTPVLPSYPILAGQNADYSFKQMRDFKSGARSNDQYGMMKETLADIPEQEMLALAYWLSTQ